MGENTSGTAKQGGAVEQPPDAVRRQVKAVDRRIEEVAALFRGSGADAARGVARLAFDWSLLEAQLERSAPRSSIGEATLGLWASPPLDQLRERLRGLLRVGVIYSRNPVTSLGLIAQLYLLAAKLNTHEATLRALRGEASSSTQTRKTTEYRVEYGAG